MKINKTNFPLVINASSFNECLAMAPETLREGLPVEAQAAAVRLAEIMMQQQRGRKDAAQVLLYAALRGGLLLPYSSTFQSPRVVLGRKTFPELPSLVMWVDSHVHAEVPRWMNDDLHFNLLMATSCRTSGDFSLKDFSLLHLHLMEIGEVSRRAELLSPPYMLLRGLELAPGVAVSRLDRHKYFFWNSSGREVALDEFLSNPVHMEGRRIHGRKRERVEEEKQISERAAREKKNARRLMDKPLVARLREIAASERDGAPEEYFEALSESSNVNGFRPSGWLERPTSYPGREHVSIKSLGELWFFAFQSFFASRGRSGCESDSVPRAVVSLLADYILLYLPWWFERNPDADVHFPTSPSDFMRYAFVVRENYDSSQVCLLGALPRTFYELLPLRKKTAETRNTVRRMLAQFFDHVEGDLSADPRFMQQGFGRPIIPALDNEGTVGRTKSSKVPFVDDVWTILKSYGQAVEAFGEHLQQLAYLEDGLRHHRVAEAGYQTEEWGFVPLVFAEGRAYPVKWIPNLYRVVERKFYSNPSNVAGIYVAGAKINVGENRLIVRNIPHLTTLRLLISILDSGLRGQHFRWLDIRSFDELAEANSSLLDYFGSEECRKYYRLSVAVDKVHDEWHTACSWRVQRALLAERYFQQMMADQAWDGEVPYENRENSRFPDIAPLFRTTPYDGRAGGAISANNYRNKWVEFLFGFENFYNNRGAVDGAGAPATVTVVSRKPDVPDTARLHKRYRAIHTPHACRTTFATEMSEHLEIEETAMLLGQSSSVVARYYQILRLEKVIKKVESVERQRSASYLSEQSHTHLPHPERAESAFQRAFAQNRTAAIGDFSVIGGVSIWSLKDLEHVDALAVLRKSPAAIIRFHSTHICPVGNQCPKEVVALIGAPRRCGICPLAAKGVDHLPAIECECNMLLERARSTTQRMLFLQKSGMATADEIDMLQRERRLDIKERLGWTLAADIIRKMGSEKPVDSYQVFQPELVRSALKLVTRTSTDVEFLLQRISESSEYPTLETPRVRAKAEKYTRMILAKMANPEVAFNFNIPEFDEVATFVGLVRPFASARGLGIAELAGMLSNFEAADSLPSEVKLLDAEG